MHARETWQYVHKISQAFRSQENPSAHTLMTALWVKGFLSKITSQMVQNTTNKIIVKQSLNVSNFGSKYKTTEKRFLNAKM